MIIDDIAENLKQDPKVWGILLVGSHARGDATAGSDIDVWVLLRDVLERRFRSQQIEGQWVEFRFNNLNQAQVRMQQNPMERYRHLDGKIRYDPIHQLQQLATFAKAQFASYEQPETERKDLAYWLASTGSQLAVALDQQDSIRMGYLASINGWKILEGRWASNKKPMPPSALVGVHLASLELAYSSSEIAQQLFDAPSQTPAKKALELIAWILPRIS